MLHVSNTTDNDILVGHAPSVSMGVFPWDTLMSLSDLAAGNCRMSPNERHCMQLAGSLIAGHVRNIWSDVMLPNIYHVSMSRPYQSRSEQACLASSDLSHTHLALAGMCFDVYCHMAVGVCVQCLQRKLRQACSSTLP